MQSIMMYYDDIIIYDVCRFLLHATDILKLLYHEKYPYAIYFVIYHKNLINEHTYITVISIETC